MSATSVTLFFGGDTMTGRGVDQILRTPSEPGLREPSVTDAREYVALAERLSGPVPRGASPGYIWGEALDELERVQPAARIVNLETSVTRSSDYAPNKAIHYRMHPDNVACLTAAGLDVCVLANNHVLDFGRSGLAETLTVLERAGVLTAGAGLTLAGARRPAVCQLSDGRRVVVVSCGHRSSGIPLTWAAGSDQPGVDLLADLREPAAADVASRATANKRPGDLAIVSVHWGDNWGYEVPGDHVRFAHWLIDRGVDVVYGHSSHHVRPVEIYRGKLVLYGCGDLIDDYEGISGYESFRDDLALLYFPTLASSSGRLVTLEVTPMQIHRLRLRQAPAGDARWLRDVLQEICSPFGSRVTCGSHGRLIIDAA